MSDQYRRVVVTGMGVITPIGNTIEEFWLSAINGISGIDNFAHLDTSNYPCKVAGEIKDFDPTEYMDKKSARRDTNLAIISVFYIHSHHYSFFNICIFKNNEWRMST